MTTLSSEIVYKKNQDYIARKIAGELVLIPLQRQLEAIKSIYNMNEMGCAIWEMIDGQRKLEDIRRELLKRYDVEPAQLDQDLNTLLTQLEEIKAIQTA